ncbi:bifunctional riboflavin kinase/FAD synthetase [Spirulina major CS-329]|uniref:bifunctional riboflavin kinase/FAD synthetase n=1 Tax=Spirulina TaxID=1154 RepID=UPI00233028CE|nr:MULTISPECIES: bifunctional riboflavin kinase/FAD synthetase [Spirulina]MDB9495420.1 bifunctional riboflavin kinase/FAD synthetase [Spirulina subsalsa CS-330]MDB9504068.1 bifunctional riboflavin kinase/FAD synthetase [Spirulina major CS-329]
MWITSSTQQALTPTALALGNFDGVHRGHQTVMAPIARPQLGESPLVSTVVTFDPHPREFFSGDRRPLLTPLAEKVQQLEAFGIEQLVLLPFTATLARMTPQAFVDEILIAQLQAQRVSVGADFCFGRDRSGTATALQAIAAASGCEVRITPLHCHDTERVSSSGIRQALAAGDMAIATAALGRPYTLHGVVVQGQQLGRTIGFPTANLQVPDQKLLPRHGVYRVRVSSAAGLSNLTGVMNIGCRPTVSGTKPTIEVHLLDWSGDLYGETLAIAIEKFIRPEQKFPSLDALKAQIAADCQGARV